MRVPEFQILWHLWHVALTWKKFVSDHRMIIYLRPLSLYTHLRIYTRRICYQLSPLLRRSSPSVKKYPCRRFLRYLAFGKSHAVMVCSATTTKNDTAWFLDTVTRGWNPTSTTGLFLGEAQSIQRYWLYELAYLRIGHVMSIYICYPCVHKTCMTVCSRPIAISWLVYVNAHCKSKLL